MINNLTVNFNKEFKDLYVIITVTCGFVSPVVLKTIDPPNCVTEGFADKGVILQCGEKSMPIWLWCYLVHFYHPAKFVAVNHPRSSAAVVVEDHSGLYEVGDLIKF